MHNAFLANDVLLYNISGEKAMENHVFAVFCGLIDFETAKTQPDAPSRSARSQWALCFLDSNFPFSAFQDNLKLDKECQCCNGGGQNITDRLCQKNGEDLIFIPTEKQGKNIDHGNQ